MAKKLNPELYQMAQVVFGDQVPNDAAGVMRLIARARERAGESEAVKASDWLRKAAEAAKPQPVVFDDLAGDEPEAEDEGPSETEIEAARADVRAAREMLKKASPSMREVAGRVLEAAEARLAKLTGVSEPAAVIRPREVGPNTIIRNLTQRSGAWVQMSHTVAQMIVESVDFRSIMKVEDEGHKRHRWYAHEADGGPMGTINISFWTGRRNPDKLVDDLSRPVFLVYFPADSDRGVSGINFYAGDIPADATVYALDFTNEGFVIGEAVRGPKTGLKPVTAITKKKGGLRPPR